MDKGQDSQSITTSTDNVMVPLLNCYYNNGTCTTGDNEPPEIAQNEAHSYGEITPGQNACLYTTNDDIFNTRQDCDYFINRNQHEFAYRFMEYNPDDGGRSYPYLTHRLIKASAGKCYQYTTGTPHNIASHNGPRSIRVWPYKNGTYNETIAIPISDTAFDSTTYAYLGDLEPQNAPLQRCGPRCIKLYAFRSGGPVTNRDEAVFQCPITISDVTNSTNQAHDVPNDVARMAAASIALTGRYTNLPGDAPGQKHWQQFQLYPLGYVCPFAIPYPVRFALELQCIQASAITDVVNNWLTVCVRSSRWEIDGLEPDMVGARMSEFAIGSLTAMAKLNKKTQIQGTLPTLGYRLSIHWNYVLAIAISIAGVHCLLVGVILWIARPIVIPGDSTLITARLLQGLVGRVGDEGGLMGERELAAAIEKRGGGEGGDFEGGRDGKGTVGYGVEKQQGKTVLRIGSGMAKRKDLDEGKFPGGVYA